MKREILEILAGFMVASLMLFGLTWLFAGLLAVDETTYTPAGDDCVAYYHKVNNWWLTPGREYTETALYCGVTK